ncbi:NADP-dependent oxidoreductase [Nocardiopsis sp. HNM0947]|uniref:NADP-dependent oxidoreductase n=1 Tax=Nocardiopsis coralli TaxID=2772213 RepID=A0ABR9P483_9ACTN|nr:NADP-dependent oxidoreductase [Nocardiopsis coralli]MBE2998649.1 NADP-dependent oxidoreductase [Nocardiopsis coralli]
MRAIRQETLGTPDVLKEEELPVPQPGPGQIRVRTVAAGVNPTDWKHRETGLFLGEPPFVLGWDVSGVVDEVGFGTTLFRPGDEVFGMVPYPYGVGTHAEYVVGPTRAFALKPPEIDHVTAGAVPLAALTAWQALVDTAGVGAGDRVLVHAAAGGVGHLAVQIAKARGAHVIGTASEPKHTFVRSLGADEVVDYRSVDVGEAVRDVDVVLDAVGGADQVERSVRALRPGGTVVTLLPFDAPETAARAEEQGSRIAQMLVEHDHQGMRSIAALVARGALRPTIADTFPLAEAARAHEIGERGRTTGKLVLTVG